MGGVGTLVCRTTIYQQKSSPYNSAIQNVENFHSEGIVLKKKDILHPTVKYFSIKTQ